VESLPENRLSGQRLATGCTSDVTEGFAWHHAKKFRSSTVSRVLFRSTKFSLIPLGLDHP